jgi:ABC-type anion transport system duplicated permease subunit
MIEAFELIGFVVLMVVAAFAQLVIMAVVSGFVLYFALRFSFRQVEKEDVAEKEQQIRAQEAEFLKELRQTLCWDMLPVYTSVKKWKEDYAYLNAELSQLTRQQRKLRHNDPAMPALERRIARMYVVVEAMCRAAPPNGPQWRETQYNMN